MTDEKVGACPFLPPRGNGGSVTIYRECIKDKCELWAETGWGRKICSFRLVAEAALDRIDPEDAL